MIGFQPRSPTRSCAPATSAGRRVPGRVQAVLPDRRPLAGTDHVQVRPAVPGERRSCWVAGGTAGVRRCCGRSWAPPSPGPPRSPPRRPGRSPMRRWKARPGSAGMPRTPVGSPGTSLPDGSRAPGRSGNSLRSTAARVLPDPLPPRPVTHVGSAGHVPAGPPGPVSTTSPTTVPTWSVAPCSSTSTRVAGPA